MIGVWIADLVVMVGMRMPDGVLNKSNVTVFPEREQGAKIRGLANWGAVCVGWYLVESMRRLGHMSARCALQNQE